jgi:hypothetical protein
MHDPNRYSEDYLDEPAQTPGNNSSMSTTGLLLKRRRAPASPSVPGLSSLRSASPFANRDSTLQHGVDAGPLPEILVERI